MRQCGKKEPLELQVRPMRVVVGEQGFGIGNLNMRVVDANGGGDEDEVYLRALEGRKLTELMPGVGGACVVGRHVVSIV